MRYLIALALAAFLAAPAWAQPPNPEEPDMVVVVTATRIETPVSQAASDVTVITRRQIEDSGARDVTQVLAEVPGLTVSSGGARGSVTSVFVRGGESDHNLVLIDGVRVNQAGGAYDWSRLTTDNVDHIEIIRGPQSALYGSDAITSVIQIFTRRGSGPPHWTLGGGQGSDGQVQSRLSTAAGNAGRDYSLGYATSRGDGVAALNNTFANSTLSGSYRARPRPGLDWGLTLRHNDSTYDFPFDEIGGLPAGAAFPAADPRQFSGDLRTALGLDLHFEPSPNLEHRLQVSLGKLRWRYEDPRDPIPSDAFGPVETIANDDHLGVDLLTHLRRGRSVTSFGLNYDNETYSQDALFGGFASSLRRSRYTRALYAQQEWSRPDAWVATIGARYDHNSTFGDNVSPRLSAARWLAPGRTKVRASFGRGIKEPTFVENFSRGFAIGNPDLVAEKSRSWDVGVDHQVRRGLGLSATAFHTNFDDMIAFVMAPDFSSGTWKNVQAAKSSGVELALDWRGPGSLRATAGYTRLHTQVTDAGGAGSAAYEQGKPLIRRPKNSYFYTLGWGRGRWRYDLVGSIVGARDDADFSLFPAQRVRLDAYHLVDFAASYDLGGYRLQGRIANLLNQAYQPIYRYQAPGRRFLLTVDRAW